MNYGINGWDIHLSDLCLYFRLMVISCHVLLPNLYVIFVVVLNKLVVCFLLVKVVLLNVLV